MLWRYTWESQKQELQHYERQHQDTSILYQIVYHSRDGEYQWESRFQHEYGVLRNEVTKTLDEERSADFDERSTELAPKSQSSRARSNDSLLTDTGRMACFTDLQSWI
jgi:hypothetical protein